VRGTEKLLQPPPQPHSAPDQSKIKPILRMPPQPAEPAMGLTATQAATWLSITSGTTDADHPWDAAHRLLAPGQPFAAAGVGNIEAIEPNLAQGWFDDAKENELLDEAKFCAFDPQDDSGHQAPGQGLPGISVIILAS